MKRKTPSENRGRVKITATKIAKTPRFIKFLADGRSTTLHGLQAQVLLTLLAVGKEGIPCSGDYRAVVSNLPQVIAAIKKKKILVTTKRDENRKGRYVLESNLMALDVRST